MLRILVCSTLLIAATSPAFADAKDDAIAACAKMVKRDGIAINVANNYSASGSGERFQVTVRATVSGRQNAQVICKTNKGRVTQITYG